MSNGQSRNLMRIVCRPWAWLVLGMVIGVLWSPPLAMSAMGGMWQVQDEGGEAAALAGGEEQQTRVDAQLQRKIRLLQRKLNSDDQAQRDEAEQELLDLGAPALDYLPDENFAYSAEFNARLRRVRLGLELAVAESITKPMSVTLRGDLPLSQVVEAISKQTGNRLTIAPDLAEKSMQLDWQSVSFYEAVDTISQQIGAGLQMNNQEVRLYSYPGSPQSKHIDYSKGFRMSAVSIRSNRDLVTGSLTTRLALQLRWEPRLRLIKLEMPFRKLSIRPAGQNEAEDATEPEEEDSEDGESEPGGGLEFGISRAEYESTFEVPVNMDGEEIRRVDVQGSFRALIAGRNEVFRFDDLEKAIKEKPEIERSGIKLKFGERRDDEYLTGFQLTLSFADAKKSLESHYGWVYENPVYLVDPEGKRHEALTVESAGQTESESSMLFLFDKMEDATGWSLEYHTPGILVETEVPFHLKNILLP